MADEAGAFDPRRVQHRAEVLGEALDAHVDRVEVGGAVTPAVGADARAGHRLRGATAPVRGSVRRRQGFPWFLPHRASALPA